MNLRVNDYSFMKSKTQRERFGTIKLLLLQQTAIYNLKRVTLPAWLAASLLVKVFFEICALLDLDELTLILTGK